MVAVHDPYTAGPMVFADVQRGVELVEDVGPAAKLSRISQLVGSRLGNGVLDLMMASDSETGLTDAERGPAAAISGVRPWADQECPEIVIHQAEAQFYANDRIVSMLMGHLLEHVVIGEELRSIASSARRRAADELGAIPATMVDFVNRLMACGIAANDVKNMSRQRLAGVVSAIRGTSVEAVMDDVPEGIPAEAVLPEWPSDVAPDGDATLSEPVSETVSGGVDAQPPAEAGSQGDAVVTEHGAPGPQDVDGKVPAAMSEMDLSGDGGVVVSEPDRTADAGSDAVSDAGSDAVADGTGDTVVTPSDGGIAQDSETVPGTPSDMPERTLPVASVEPVDEPMPEPVQPVRPRGIWDDLDLTALGYRIEDATASTDADMTALRMVLPTARTLREIALPKSTETMLADGVDGQKDRTLFDKFVRTYSGRTGVRISEMEKRVMALLLVDLHTGGKGRQLGLRGWYHGVVLPGTDGSTRVRRIVSIDQSEEALEAAFAR